MSVALAAPSGPLRASRLFEAAGVLYRKLRLKNPWNYKAPLLVSLPYFMIAAGEIPWPTALLAVGASFATIAGIAGVAYALNDIADVEKDRLAGKENLFGRMGRAQKVLVLAAFTAAALGPWLYLPSTPVTRSVLAAELLLFVVYCFPPFRLKERGAWGVAADALYAHAVPAVLAVLTFDLMASRPYARLPAFVASVAVWQLALGVRNILLHQVQDHDADVASGTRTLATRRGPDRVARILGRGVVPFEVLGFGLFVAVTSPTLPSLLPAYAAFLALTTLRARYVTRRAAPSTLRERLYAYGDEFYLDWLPLVVLGHLVLTTPGCWPLAAAHLLLFRNGFRQWGGELRSALAAGRGSRHREARLGTETASGRTEMRQVFRDPELQAQFDEQGFVFHDFLGAPDVERLRDLYMKTAGAGHETYAFASKLSYYISVFDKSSENRRVANDGIRALFEDVIDDVLVDYRILYCNFMVKEPGGGEIEAHQDYTWVDEASHVAFNLWVPLQDTDAANGGFHLIPGSHRFIQNSYRAATIPHTLYPYNRALKPYMVCKPVPAGRGIVFDHRLFHYSPDNTSGVPRVAAQLVLIPRESRPVLAHYDAADPDHVRLLEIPDDSYLMETNFWEAPPKDLRVLDTRRYSKLPDEPALIDLVRQRTQGG